MASSPPALDGEGGETFSLCSIEGSINKFLVCGRWFLRVAGAKVRRRSFLSRYLRYQWSSRRRGQFSLQFLVRREQGGTPLPYRFGFITAAGLLISISQPGVGLCELRLWHLSFLLLNKRLEILDDFVAFVQHRGPV